MHFYTAAKLIKPFHTGFSGHGGDLFGPREPPGVPGTGELGFHGAGPGDVTLYVRSHLIII